MSIRNVLDKGKIMGYAELIQQRLQGLSQEKLAEVYDFVELIATRDPVVETLDEVQRKARLKAVLAAARGAWPKMGPEKVDKLVASMRAEWDGRGWESKS